MADMNFIYNSIFGNGENGGQPRRRQSRPPKGSKASRLLISLSVMIVFGLVYFYVNIPALNYQSGQLYWFIFWLCVVYSLCMLMLRGYRADKPGEYVKYFRKQMAVPFWIVIAMLVFVIVGSLIGMKVFRARDYSQLLIAEQGSFAEEVAEVSWNQIPMLDDKSANNLTNRKLGELSDLVSQFTVSNISAQINYKGRPVRVTYLNYDNFFKWLSNRGKGIPAYMVVDMVTQNVEVVRLENGIKYSPSELFNRDLQRHLRFLYPTFIFGDINFEIDEDGTPWWVASVVKRTIGLFGGTDIKGAVLVNAETGEAQYYEAAEVPTWVDRVYSAALIIEQYDYYGHYRNGFWNYTFSQNGCTETTDGYNYIAMNDDVWMYTGITSVSDDRGNIGFILVNQRTKQARYYSSAGAEEFSAMSSAEGAVQQYSYVATFPLLLNISDQPTYFMALKDGAGLVKMYAMVNVQQYQIVAIGSTVEECQKQYHNLMITNKIIDGSPPQPQPDTLKELKGRIEEIRSAAIDGNTWFYIRLKGSDIWFTISAKVYPKAVIMNIGDTVTLSYIPSDSEIIEAVSIE
jgi:hypothetical protein